MKKVMIFGTFDGLHMGHIHLITQAKALGNTLMTVIARDRRVNELKGRFPLHHETERKNIVGLISLVDEVTLGHKDNVYACIELHKPDIIALGYDQTHYTQSLEEELKKRGFDIEIVRIEPYKPKTHKTSIIRDTLEKMI
jgi:FAD synthetase